MIQITFRLGFEKLNKKWLTKNKQGTYVELYCVYQDVVSTGLPMLHIYQSDGADGQHFLTEGTLKKKPTHQVTSPSRFDFYVDIELVDPQGVQNDSRGNPYVVICLGMKPSQETPTGYDYLITHRVPNQMWTKCGGNTIPDNSALLDSLNVGKKYFSS